MERVFSFVVDLIYTVFTYNLILPYFYGWFIIFLTCHTCYSWSFVCQTNVLLS